MCFTFFLVRWVDLLLSENMHYSNSWLSFLDYICYPFTFYLCKFTGILPSWVNGNGFTIESLFHTAAGKIVI